MDSRSSPRRVPAVRPRVGTIVITCCLLLAFMGTVAISPVGATALSTMAALDAPYLGSPAASNPAVVGVTAGADGNGYYLLRSDGEVDAFGATSYGSVTANSLAPGVTATGIAFDSATGGYWVLSSSGIVEGFNAPFLGEPHIRSGGWGQFPAAVAIAAAPDGAGYYVLRANGAVDAYGVSADGSLAGHLHYAATAPVVAVAIAVDPTTGGYWIATSTGDVAGFDAPNYGSPLSGAHGTYGGLAVSALAATTSGTGYYVLEANGAVENSGTAPPHGSLVASSVWAQGGFASALAVDPTTGGYYVTLDAAPLDGYLNPLRALTSLVPQEIDQGVDYCASGPIYALGNGVVVNLFDPGWPSGVFISYRLSSGPAKGLYVYVAENVTPHVSIGERVTATTIVGIIHDAKTCVETGWADAPASPERAAGHAQYNGKNSTAYGLNFSSLLQALGARPGLPQNDGPPGSLPPGWPAW